MPNVLIAEDDMITAKILYANIKKMGYEPVVSPDGAHALKTLRANSDIKVLVSDVMMPEMDGKDLTRIIRADVSYKEFPIILCSAVIGIKEIGALIDLGATWFLPKPINIAEFESVLKSCFE